MATKAYIVLFSALILLFTATILHALSQDSSIKKAQNSYAKLTKIVEPSLSVAPLESRFLYLQKSYNRVYPELLNPSRVGFVYAK